MSLSHDLHISDSLRTLLQKAHAIHTVNQENISDIFAQKGHQVVVKQQYTLQTKPPKEPPYKKPRTQPYITHDHHMLKLFNRKSTKNAKEIIATWIYRGEKLTKEKIAIDDFIDRKLVDYDDLIRLHKAYGRMVNRYSRILQDEAESRVAAEILVHNMEILHDAIGKLHEQLQDISESNYVSDAITLLMKDLSKDLSKSLNKFQSRVSGIRLNVNLETELDEGNSKAEDSCKLKDCKAMTCKCTLSEHEGHVWALQPYMLNDKQYLASASEDKTIKVWDLSTNTVIDTLTGHTADVSALALYTMNGIPMLASASEDKTIKLWNLSNNANYNTLFGHDSWINSLAVYEKSDTSILISGSNDQTIKLWDIDNFCTLATLIGHDESVHVLAVYKHNDKPYLASGSHDNTIKIWSLEDLNLIATLENVGHICSLLAIKYEGKHVLTTGDEEGMIKLWSLEDYNCIITMEAHSRPIYSLSALEHDGNVRLVSGSYDDKIKVWDLQNQSVVTTLSNYAEITSMKVSMNGDCACIVCGDGEGKIKLWMQ